MADLHKAIRAIHSDVVTIHGNTKEDIRALNDSGNSVTINWTNVEAWTDPMSINIKELPNTLALLISSIKYIMMALINGKKK